MAARITVLQIYMAEEVKNEMNVAYGKEMVDLRTFMMIFQYTTL